jgi:hypothetical protein
MAYYSVNEEKKPRKERVYHTDQNCRSGRDIPKKERESGTGSYRHCKNCTK